MVAVHTAADIIHHVIQECIVGEGGSGFNFNGNLPAAAVHILHKIPGLPDGRHQLGHHLSAGFPLVAGHALQNLLSLFVAAGQLGDISIPVILHDDFRVHAHHQSASVRQRRRLRRICLRRLSLRRSCRLPGRLLPHEHCHRLRQAAAPGKERRAQRQCRQHSHHCSSSGFPHTTSSFSTYLFMK